MEKLACLVVALLSACAAEAQAPSFNAVPRLGDPPLVDYTAAPTRPAATIQPALTNTIPAATIQATPPGLRPAPLPSPSLDASTVMKLSEPIPDAVAKGLESLPSTPTIRRGAEMTRILGKSLPIASVVLNGTSALASLYRAGDCAAKGDMQGHDRAWGDAKYEVLEAIPGVDLALACADVIGSKVFDVKVRDVIVSNFAEQKRQERELEALGVYEPHPLYGTASDHVWPERALDAYRARLNAAFQSTRQANEQATANRVATQQSAAPYDPQFANQMMWMLMPAMIAASQPRPVQPPRAAPSAPPAAASTDGTTFGCRGHGPLPCHHYYHDGRLLDTAVIGGSTGSSGAPGRSFGSSGGSQTGQK